MGNRLKTLSAKAAFWVKTFSFFLCLLPAVRLVLLGFMDGLGANPIEFITRSTGFWTLILLLVTLCVTPLRKFSGWQWLGKLRRLLGLFAFFYALLHFTTYIWLDQFFVLADITKDIIKRPFITLGFASFVLLLPLAITSNRTMTRKLGGARWQKLHRLVYAVALGGVIHFWWLVKKDITQPVLFASALGVLLLIRVTLSLRQHKFSRRP